jgi:hypothetical protein
MFLETCPYSGVPCEKADAIAEYIQTSYIDNRVLRPQALKPLLVISVKCEGIPETCTPLDSEAVDGYAELMKNRLEEKSEHPALDERGVELSIKAKDPIDRALIWTQRLPEAIVESKSADLVEKITGYKELTRIRDAFREFYDGYLVYPRNEEEVEMFLGLVSISSMYLGFAPSENKLTESSTDVSAKFAQRYIRREDDASLQEMDEVMRVLQRAEITNQSNEGER